MEVVVNSWVSVFKLCVCNVGCILKLYFNDLIWYLVVSFRFVIRFVL